MGRCRQSRFYLECRDFVFLHHPLPPPPPPSCQRQSNKLLDTITTALTSQIKVSTTTISISSEIHLHSLNRLINPTFRHQTFHSPTPKWQTPALPQDTSKENLSPSIPTTRSMSTANQWNTPPSYKKSPTTMYTSAGHTSLARKPPEAWWSLVTAQSRT